VAVNNYREKSVHVPEDKLHSSAVWHSVCMSARKRTSTFEEPCMRMTSEERKVSKTKRAGQNRKVAGVKAAGKIAVKLFAIRALRPILARIGSRIIVRISRKAIIRFLKSRAIASAKSAVIRVIAAKALVVLGGKPTQHRKPGLKSAR
jgi:hypothetical protein